MRAASAHLTGADRFRPSHARRAPSSAYSRLNKPSPALGLSSVTTRHGSCGANPLSGSFLNSRRASGARHFGRLSTDRICLDWGLEGGEQRLVLVNARRICPLIEKDGQRLEIRMGHTVRQHLHIPGNESLSVRFRQAPRPWIDPEDSVAQRNHGPLSGSLHDFHQCGDAAAFSGHTGYRRYQDILSVTSREAYIGGVDRKEDLALMM